MYLYCFYDFPELKTYSNELLKRQIGTNDTLYLMASFCGNIILKITMVIMHIWQLECQPQLLY